MTENLVHFPNGKVESFTVSSVVSSHVFIQHLIRIEIKFSILLHNFKNPNLVALLILRPVLSLQNVRESASIFRGTTACSQPYFQFLDFNFTQKYSGVISKCD